MTDTIVQTSIDDQGIATLSMNRPEVHNAFDDIMIAKMTESLRQLDETPEVILIALCAAGKSFSAGADLNWMRRMADYNWDENYQDSLGLASLMSTLAGLRTPTCAVVQGAAFGGGVGLVACCDFALASTRAKFCLSEVKLGLIPAVISPYVVRAMGRRNASRYFTSAEVFDAQTACRLGLISEVFEPDEFDAGVARIFTSIAANAPKAVREAKKLIQYVAQNEISEEVIRETAQRIADRRASLEGREGLSAFLQKRTPNWPKETVKISDLVDGDNDDF